MSSGSLLYTRMTFSGHIITAAATAMANTAIYLTPMAKRVRMESSSLFPQYWEMRTQQPTAKPLQTV